ncbi:MAG: dockerin type I domain-containing protein, partial [Bacteroidaceae bacterium]
SAIDSAANSYSVLGKAECVNVANYNTLKTDMQSYGSLTGGADVNLDTNTDIKDLVALKKITANAKAKTFMADVSGDGSVNAADITAAKRILLGIV